MLDLGRFEVLTFDCYGTIVDWERGIVAALEPIFAAHGAALEPERVLERYAEIEAALEAGEYLPYREVLVRVVAGLGERFGFEPSAEERERFAASVGDWPPFPDSTEALRALGSRYRLVVVSNVDDDLFAATARRLGIEFDAVVTAQQVRSYKPALENFRRALVRIGRPPKSVLHVAQSLFHDIVPAKRLGLATVWVNRRGDREGSGATPPAHAEPDLVVPDLATLARRAGVA